MTINRIDILRCKLVWVILIFLFILLFLYVRTKLWEEDHVGVEIYWTGKPAAERVISLKGECGVSKETDGFSRFFCVGVPGVNCFYAHCPNQNEAIPTVKTRLFAGRRKAYLIFINACAATPEQIAIENARQERELIGAWGVQG